MKWSWHELEEANAPIHVDRKLDLNPVLAARHTKMIHSMGPVKVQATMKYEFGVAELKADVQVRLITYSTRSLRPVHLPLHFKFAEIYVTNKADLQKYLREHPHGLTALVVDPEGSIDFDNAIVDNIILHLPSKVLSPKEKSEHLMPKGRDWEVISEADFERNRAVAKSKTIDPRLAKLKNFFK